MIGKTIAHYRVKEKIGEGGMGEVYLAEDTSLMRKVAIKVLPEILQNDEVAHIRFLREARSAAALDHPFICNIHEVAETADGKDFIVMEYVDGQTLKARLTKDRIPLKESLRICSEITEALEKAHKAGIVHRDLKPTNIMLTSEGHAKVMDFGLAKKVVKEDGTEQDLSTTLTRDGSTLGTPPYMSPEQLKAVPVDQRSDIFSFGIVLYEMLTGVHPFRKGRHEETVTAILRTDPAPLSRYMDKVPELLQRTITKMLAKNPDDRYQTAHEVRTNLREVSGELTRPSEVVIPAKKKSSWPSVGLGTVGLILLVLIGNWGWNLLRQSGAGIEQDRKSIAVLPFDNLSSNPDDIYFSDGITEDITAELSMIRGLKVIARTSSFRFRGSDKTIRQIAEELGVTTILEGSVRREGDEVRIVAQLIDADTEEHLWAQRYDRELSDVFEIQSDVAKQIAAALSRQLSAQEIREVESIPTENMEAYDAYLQGRFFAHMETPMGIQQASRYLSEATNHDPDFTAAYAELAWVYILMDYLSMRDHQEVMKLAIAAATKALNLNRNDALALWASAIIEYHYHYDWNKAEAHFQRALGLNSSVYLHWEYGQFLMRLGRFDEALAQIKIVRELDPLSTRAVMGIGLVELFSGNSQQAIQHFLKVKVRQELGMTGEYFLAMAYEQNGELDKAVELLEQIIGSSEAPAYVAMLVNVYAKLGSKGLVEELLSQLDAKLNEGVHQPYVMAYAYIGVGQTDKVLQFLEEAYEERIPGMVYLKINPSWNTIRDDPRFIDLMRRMNFPE